jgi:hypothetical protein
LWCSSSSNKRGLWFAPSIEFSDHLFVPIVRRAAARGMNEKGEFAPTPARLYQHGLLWPGAEPSKANGYPLS